jgi:non-heme chloroperoxidase
MTKINTTLNVRDASGAGTPIILIHGFPLSHEAFDLQFDELKNAGLRPIAYDRRGFGRSEITDDNYDYDSLADDLHRLIREMGLSNCVLLGFSMGGGEVARYVTRHGEGNLSGLIFAAAVTPYLARTPDNPEGPLDAKTAQEKLAALQADRDSYFNAFVKKFYDVNGKVVVDQSEIDKSVAICHQSDPVAAVECMKAFSTTDFRSDLKVIRLPTLVIHGDSDAVVPFKGSGERTHEMVAHSKLEIITGGPHGMNVSHHQQFNLAILDFVQSLPVKSG